MIDRIEMRLMNYNVLMDDRQCLINDKNCFLKNDDIDNMIRIIRDWDSYYKNDKIMGDNICNIKIVSENKEYVYEFCNKFPANFKELVDYIGGIYDR